MKRSMSQRCRKRKLDLVPKDEAVTIDADENNCNRSRKSPQESFVSKEGDAAVYAYQHSKQVHRTFLSYMEIEIRQDCFTNPENYNGKKWYVRVGDAVCVLNQEANERDDISLSRNWTGNIWYPFKDAWSVCQILSIYKDVTNSKEEVHFEIRLFHRKSDLNRRCALRTRSVSPEEVFETDLIRTVTAKSFLGEVEFVGNGYTINTSMKRELNDAGTVPIITHSCTRFYASDERRLVPFHPAVRESMERIMSFSHVLQETDEIRKAICDSLEIYSSPQRTFRKERARIKTRRVRTALALDMDESCYTDNQFFTSLALPYQWNYFLYSRQMCIPRDRDPNWKWNLSVGDYVVAKYEPRRKNQKLGNIWFPYNVAWKPCQILAIYKDKLSNNTLSSNLTVEIRFFRRESQCIDAVFHETDNVVSLPVDDILGPIDFISEENEKTQDIWNSDFFCSLGKLNNIGGTRDKNLLRGVSCSEFSLVSKKMCYLEWLHSEMQSPKVESDCDLEDCIVSVNSSDSISPERLERIWASRAPYHVDISARKAFYSDIIVCIPFEMYDHPYDHSVEQGTNRDLQWVVRLGDTVTVHAAENQKNTIPFVVPFWRAEVIAIFSNVGEEQAKLLKKDARGENCGSDNTDCNKNFHKVFGDFHIELRYLYQKSDIPGVDDNSSSKELFRELEIVEIFETDDVGEAPAESLLSPIALHSDPNQAREFITSHLGMPVLNYYCHRFWSSHRKSLMPIGASQNRLDRGMMYSKYLGQYDIAKAASGIGANSFHKKHRSNNFYKHWRERFHDAFSKLTLTEALADVKMHRGVLIGREAEQKQIANFLRSAIQSVNPKGEMSSNVTFSLFVAGPPGTGKTASVCSIISQLQQEQSDGEIPAFKFVSLNGMEMRHPFDCYIRLWEAVSSSKEKCSAGQAAARLEAHFGGRVHSRKDIDINIANERSITVVLLDEIDYMLTKKQTVLYNLFDWPIRGALEKSDSQLIVIGISNTLNLPERLHRRVQSRLGKERCIYSSYKTEESANILKKRLGVNNSLSSCIFHPDALTLAARKMAAESGDIRKAFHLCLAAAEAVYADIDSGKIELSSLPSSGEWVGIGNVQKASREMFSTVIHKAVFHATAYEALLLVTLACMNHDTSYGKVGFNVVEILERMRSLASSFGDENYSPVPSFAELLGILNRLGEARVLVLQTPNGKNQNGGRMSVSMTTVMLQLEDYEVLNALTDTSHNKLAEKYLARSRFF